VRLQRRVDAGLKSRGLKWSFGRRRGYHLLLQPLGLFDAAGDTEAQGLILLEKLLDRGLEVLSRYLYLCNRS
jgi:hypothetical protein